MQDRTTVEIEINIIIPCYNSDSFIKNSFRNLESFISNHPKIKVFFVDDGSKDLTYKYIKESIDDSSFKEQFTLLRCQVNGGKGAAIKYGMQNISVGKVLFMDPDLAYDLNNIYVFYEVFKPGQLLVADRMHEKSSFRLNLKQLKKVMVRHISSRVFNLFVRLLIYRKISDTQSGFKMFDAQEINRLLEKSKCNRFEFDLELLCLCQQNGICIKSLPVSFNSIESSSTVNLLKDSIAMFFSLFKLFFKKINGEFKI